MLRKTVGEFFLYIYKVVLTQHYKKTKYPEDLFWHIEGIPEILVEAVKKQKINGTALDIGSGTGKNAIYLAQSGYKVTAIDFIDEAIEISKKNAANAGVNINFIKADILKWNPIEKYDLIFDGGCLHGISSKLLRKIYKKRVLEFLIDNGEYVLAHFEKQHIFDYSPVGPRRVSRKEINKFFAPELTELHYISRKISVPFPIGAISSGAYWFKRKK